MNIEDDIEALKSRISQAECKRDAWRLAGLEEKYIEACSMVDALGASAGPATAPTEGSSAGANRPGAYRHFMSSREAGVRTDP